MTPICSLVSLAILAKLLHYLLIGLLIGSSIKFVAAFARLAAVPLKRGWLFRRLLPYLPRMKRVSCQFEQGEANPSFDLPEFGAASGIFN